MDLSELGQFKEGNRLEMKAAQGRDGNGALPRSIWETLSAFANTSGGIIVLGAEELKDGTFNVVGIKKADKVLDDFWNAALSKDKVFNIGALDKGKDGALKPTRAGLLMFGEDRWITREFPHYFLDYRQETSGETRWDDRFTSQPGDWTGNVYDFYVRVYNKLKAALKVPFRLDGVDRVDDTPAHEALREAIVNALTNANWFDRRGIVCVWRNEAITIENPGDFRMPLEEARKPGKSDPRNETIMKIFAMVEIGERAGSGMDKIFNGWEWAGYSEPSYEVEYGPDRTTLTLPLDDSSGESSDESDDYRTNKTDESPAVRARKESIAKFVGAHGPVGRSDIAEAVGLRASRASELLAEMVAEGSLVAEGEGRSRVYRAKARS